MSLQYEEFSPDARVLDMLLEKGPMKRRTFQESGINYNTAINALRRLETVGLTEWEDLEDRYGTMIWRLTPKGEEAAKKIRELDRFITK